MATRTVSEQGGKARSELISAQVWQAIGRTSFAPSTPVPALARALPLHPDDPGDPYVFRVDPSGLGIGTSRLNHLGKLGFEWLYWHMLLPGRDIPGIGTRMPLAPPS